MSDKKLKDAKALEEKVARYVERIDTLVEDEAAAKQKQIEQDARDEALDKKAEQIKNNKTESLIKIAEKQAEVDADLATLESEKSTVAEDKKLNSENEKINTSNAEQNEANAKEIKKKADDFYNKESQFRMLTAVCGHADEINVNLDKIGEELKADLRDTSIPSPLKKSLSLLFYPYLVLLYSKTIEKEH